MWKQELYIRALEFAAVSHKEQKFPGREYNYIIHPVTVTQEVIRALMESNVDKPDLAVQCAMLHDVIEDTDAKYESVEKVFGKEVADGVLALSKDSNIAKELRMQDSLKRILKQPKEVGMVKLADRITNLSEPPHYWNNEKKISYREEAIVIYETLKACNDYLAVRLKNRIEEYKNYIS